MSQRIELDGQAVENRLLQALAVPICAQRERFRHKPVNEPQTVSESIKD
jgi:hypothetical protein